MYRQISSSAQKLDSSLLSAAPLLALGSGLFGWGYRQSLFLPLVIFSWLRRKYSIAVWVIVALRCQDVLEQCYDAWSYLLPLRQAQKLNYEANVSFEEIFI